MIILVHNNIKVLKLYTTDETLKIIYDINSSSIIKTIFDIAKLYPNELLLWVNKAVEQLLNINKINTIFHHKLIMASYSIDGQYSICKRIGYVEQKPFTNVSREVSFPTWLMSSDVGGIYCETLNTIKDNVENTDFGYVLSSIAKQAMPKGLLCYSEPELIKNQNHFISEEKKPSISLLFKFVRQHYKFTWLINLLLCFIIYENKFPLISFIKSLFIKPLDSNIDLSKIQVNSNKQIELKEELDVIIPTLGRKECLYDVLKDFSRQTILPKNIIIVEQNPDKSSKTELDYIKNEKWPFTINHIFIHKAGVCNARNLALSKVTSPWVLLGDDDNRFDSSLIENFFKSIKKYKSSVATSRYIQPNEKPSYFHIAQTSIFGSGNTMLKSSLLNHVKFDMRFEFGYAEDLDFGMQLRKMGNDVIFFPDVEISHLKAPIGGFRVKQKHLWDDEKIQPKPSPTQMLFMIKHYNEFQKRGSKFIMFIKFYKKQNIKNPFKYITCMNRRWKTSIIWGESLFKKNIE